MSEGGRESEARPSGARPFGSALSLGSAALARAIVPPARAREQSIYRQFYNHRHFRTGKCLNCTPISLSEAVLRSSLRARVWHCLFRSQSR